MSTTDKDKDMSGSEPGNSSTQLVSTQPTKRKLPCCTRCSNHGLVMPLKNHKRYCRYQNCVCGPCELTVERQKVQARQTALKRALDVDKHKKILPEEVSSRPLGRRNREPRDGNAAYREERRAYSLSDQRALFADKSFVFSAAIYKYIAKRGATIYRFLNSANAESGLTNLHFRDF